MRDGIGISSWDAVEQQQFQNLHITEIVQPFRTEAIPHPLAVAVMNRHISHLFVSLPLLFFLFFAKIGIRRNLSEPSPQYFSCSAQNSTVRRICMVQSNDSAGMLDLMIHPGFCVKDNLVVKTNAAADNLRIQVGTPVQKLLATGKKEYSHFTGGCLYLVLDVHGKRCSASVNRMEDMDIFLIDQEAPESLQVLSLAARQLRDPLTSIMSVSGDLFSDFAASGNPHVLEQLARIQRGYYQMLRIIGNMSDAERYSDERPLAPELIDITALMAETFEKANTLLKDAGINFTFSLPRSPVLGLASREMLERAVLNLLSNALKFTPKGGSVSAALARRGNTLTLSVQDTG
jgi:hypothetical protein